MKKPFIIVDTRKWILKKKMSEQRNKNTKIQSHDILFQPILHSSKYDISISHGIQ